MDIQTFSQTYWYIWVLAVLLILLLVLLNGLGGYFYYKKRQKFLAELNQKNDQIPLQSASKMSSLDLRQSQYRQSSLTSAKTSRPSRFSSIKVHPPPPTIRPSQQTRSTLAPGLTDVADARLSDDIDGKDEMDLILEEFQRQALQEHNRMRAIYKRPPLKLADSLNVYAQYWADQCARANVVRSSKAEWRSHCRGEPLGENIISVPANNTFTGAQFTSRLMAHGHQSREVDCILNELTTEVGFGRSKSQPNDRTQPPHWIGVAHYYPYRQLPIVQS